MLIKSNSYAKLLKLYKTGCSTCIVDKPKEYLFSHNCVPKTKPACGTAEEEADQVRNAILHPLPLRLDLISAFTARSGKNSYLEVKKNIV